MAVILFINKHCAPLDLHPLQALRLLLLERKHQLGEKWCKPGTVLFCCPSPRLPVMYFLLGCVQILRVHYIIEWMHVLVCELV
jgi:hypothetical protein